MIEWNRIGITSPVCLSVRGRSKHPEKFWRQHSNTNTQRSTLAGLGASLWGTTIDILNATENVDRNPMELFNRRRWDHRDRTAISMGETLRICLLFTPKAEKNYKCAKCNFCGFRIWLMLVHLTLLMRSITCLLKKV